jgi:hypothetical protein
VYATKLMTKPEIALVKKNSRAGWMGHSVVGFREDGSTSIETDSEIRAAAVENVVFIRRRMPSGRYIYRRVTER